MKQVSVIIPAYNAAKLIRKAVESANQFNEVGEVIIVEDGSPDNTLDVCKKLDGEFEKVRLYTHKDNMNKGAGATRNLGITKSVNEYIAFLDADDYYLPNRFDEERRILFSDEKIDGIYGATGTVYYSDEAKEIFKEKSHPELLTVKKNIQPEELKFAMLGMIDDYNGSAFFHLNALTVKKSLIEKVGYFNELLRLHQDTDFIFKLAFMGTLVPGLIDTPIGMRGIHEHNRITTKAYGFESRSLQFSELEKWLNKNIMGEEKVKRYVRKEKIKYHEMSLKNDKISNTKRLMNLFRDEAYMLFLEKDFELLMKTMFGDNFIVKIINKFKVISFRLIYSTRINYWRQLYYH